MASICLHRYQVDLNIISSSLAQRRGRKRVIKESKELASVLFPFIKLGKDPSGLLWHIGDCSLLILNGIQKNLGILKRTWNVGIEGLRDKKEDVLAYSMKHIMMKIENKKRGDNLSQKRVSWKRVSVKKIINGINENKECDVEGSAK